MLAPGAYGYKVVTGDAAGMLTWQLDPATPYTKFVGGTENSVVEVDDCKTPLAQFKALDQDARRRAPRRGAVRRRRRRRRPRRSTRDRARSTARAAGGASIDGNGLITVDTTGLAKTKHRLVFHAADKAAHAAVDLHVPFWIEDQPFDFRDGLMYFAFTDRFRNGDPSNDTPTAGVDARANYRRRRLRRHRAGDQGRLLRRARRAHAVAVAAERQPRRRLRPAPAATSTPAITATGPRRGRDVQPRFGTLADAQVAGRRPRTRTASASSSTPCSTMCTRSTRTGRCTRTTAGSTGRRPDLRLPRGAARTATGRLRARSTCWFEPYMPDLDYTNFDALTAMIDDALFWAREVDVDGFRVDAVKHFLLAATTRLRGKLHDIFEHAGPLFYIVGETFDGDRGLINSFIGPQRAARAVRLPDLLRRASTRWRATRRRCASSSRRPAQSRHGVRRRRRCRRSSATTTCRAFSPCGGQWLTATGRAGVERAAGSAHRRGSPTSSCGWRSPSSRPRPACRSSTTATSTGSRARAIPTTVAS